MQKVLNNKMSRPLEGLTVLEFSQFLSGPYAGLRLSDLGARVIKIERPEVGDLCRTLYISDTDLEGDSTLFHAINRNKESFAANLKDPKDLDLVKKGAKKLVGTHDYSTFRSSSCHAKSPIKTIKSVNVRLSKNKIEIEFKSQSFLQQQVRSMVGCLKYLGEKKWDLKKFDKAFKSKKRILCAPPAPPEGLFLVRVIY